MNADYIFGDDGFRGVYGEQQLSRGFLSCFAKALSHFLLTHKILKLNLAHDARASAHEIIRIILKEFDNNIQVVYFGCYSTPGLAFSTINDDSMGLMITASHFSSEFNGVKLFKNGYKLKEVDERKLEVLIRQQLSAPNINLAASNNLLRKASMAKKNKYLNLLQDIFQHGGSANESLAVDCANGAGSKIANNLAKRVNLYPYNDKPSGTNINKDCGAIESPLLTDLKPATKYCILLDGDADRLALISSEFGLMESELLTAIYLHRHIPKGGRVVCSEVVNTGFINFCKKNNYELFLTPAGDRNVVERSLQENAAIGFEPSGHFFIPAYSTSMDGLLSGLLFANSLIKNQPTMAEFNIYKKLDRKITNYKLKNNDENPNHWIPLLNKSLNEIALNEERIFARKSIWENTIRIYYDGKNYVQRSGDIERILKNTKKIHD
jgi:phosphomannomutase